MKQQFVFIDDSGDPGFKKSSSSHFIVAAVVVVDEDKKQLIADAINLFRRNLGWNELHEFKFNTAKKEIVLDLIKFMKPFDFSAYAIVLDKSKITQKDIPKDKASLYHYAIKELLLRLKLTNPVITIDGRAGKQYSQRIKTYIRQSLRERGVEKPRIYIVDSRKNALIQLTDIIAGSIARSYSKDKTDAQVYKKALGDKIVKTFDLKL